MWDIVSFTKLSNIRMPLPDAFIICYPYICTYWNWTIDFCYFAFAFAFMCILCSTIKLFCLESCWSAFPSYAYFVSYYFWNAVNQHLTLDLLRQLLLSEMLLISNFSSSNFVMTWMQPDWGALCGYTTRPPYIKKEFAKQHAAFSNTERPKGLLLVLL